MAEPARLLILGGTTEAAALAVRLDGDPRLAVTSSLAGRTQKPAALPGAVRIGGFGGLEGLEAHLAQQGIGFVIDATHPFAATISRHAALACKRRGVPRLQLVRPAWQPRSGDDWREVATLEDAAALLPDLGRRVFLTIGRQEVGAFAGLTDLWFLARMIDAPEQPLPLAQSTLLLERGPFDEASETALLRRHRIDALVAKNSGGAATYAKIAAARALGLPVLMVSRPEAPPGPQAPDVEQAVDWLEAHLAERAAALPAS